MTSLVLATLFFLLIHFAISATGLRAKIANRIGEGPYRGVFSLASAGGLAWLIMAYATARDSADNAILWIAPTWLIAVGALVVLLAVLLVVLALSTPNPTMVAGERLLRKADGPKGIIRITRHPFMWGVGLWGVFHMIANGDQASAIFFGGLAILALAGTLSLDRKMKVKHGADWQNFADQTSNLPFAAIAAGRTQLSLREIGAARLALGIVVFAAFYYLHPILFGVSPHH